ncbi:hypothetical protein K488DRAFT_70709 [Vararia minispora EC-137]|uniref:Uncharacterized protein n=1 Tax=Vararia minispora EC-137 TaxID=1314806 RepID=A0ACB8QL13_9AGAM|nr:hypothetical protein K488DRAFT_70709 [Vararia minispora EC-137]
MEGGPFKDRAIVFGGDMADEGRGDEEEEREAAKALEEEVLPVMSVMPPKMRKQWARREDTADAQPFTPTDPSPATSPVIGMDASVQTTPVLFFAPPVPDARRASSPPPIYSTAVPLKQLESVEARLASTAPDGLVSTSNDAAVAKEVGRVDSMDVLDVEPRKKRERSGTPMELDSPSAPASPRPVQVAPQKPSIVSLLPDVKPADSAEEELPRQSQLSCHRQSSRLLEHQGFGPLDGLAVSMLSSQLEPASPEPDPLPSVVGPEDTSVEEDTELLPDRHTPSTPSHSSKSSKPTIVNPFVSGGFMTDFFAVSSESPQPDSKRSSPAPVSADKRESQSMPPAQAELHAIPEVRQSPPPKALSPVPKLATPASSASVVPTPSLPSPSALRALSQAIVAQLPPAKLAADPRPSSITSLASVAPLTNLPTASSSPQSPSASQFIPRSAISHAPTPPPPPPTTMSDANFMPPPVSGRQLSHSGPPLLIPNPRHHQPSFQPPHRPPLPPTRQPLPPQTLNFNPVPREPTPPGFGWSRPPASNEMRRDYDFEPPFQEPPMTAIRPPQGPSPSLMRQDFPQSHMLRLYDQPPPLPQPPPPNYSVGPRGMDYPGPPGPSSYTPGPPSGPSMYPPPDVGVYPPPSAPPMPPQPFPNMQQDDSYSPITSLGSGSGVFPQPPPPLPPPRQGIPLQSEGFHPTRRERGGQRMRRYKKNHHQTSSNPNRFFVQRSESPLSPTVNGVKRKASSPLPEELYEPLPPPSSPLPIAPARAPPAGCYWEARAPIRVVNTDSSIRTILLSDDATLFAVIGSVEDTLVHVWDNATYMECGSLPHTAPVITAAWEDGETGLGLMVLCDNGIVTRWTRQVGSGNRWRSEKVCETNLQEKQGPPDIPTALAASRDRVAVTFARSGVRIWILNSTGTHASHTKPMKYANPKDSGTALLGGTKDGVLWYCQVQGLMRAYAFFKSEVRSISVSLDGRHALISQSDGCAALVSVVESNRGKVERLYAVKDPALSAIFAYPAHFAARDDRVLWGCAGGFVLVWDRVSGEIVRGLDHGDDPVATALAFWIPADPPTKVCRTPRSGIESSMVTGTEEGTLLWWSDTSIADPGLGFHAHSPKRIKTE